jgi:hypothetical protein
VPRLIQPKLAAARHLDVDQPSKARLGNVPTELNTFGPELLDRGVNVVAHQIELVSSVIPRLGGMNAKLRWREIENQPAVTGVHRAEAEYVADERASAFSILGIDDRVRTDNHAYQSATGGSATLATTAMDEVASAVDEARSALERFGLLLFSDAALPSLVGLIVDEPLRGSWWGHPRGHVIYQAMNAFEDDPDVLSTKLLAGKVTYVQRRLWPAVYSVGCAREPWQLDGLSSVASWLLDEVDAEQGVQTNLVVRPAGLTTKVPDAARELERRLLVHATEVHTPSGAHAKVLQTWSRWASDIKLEEQPPGSEEARAQLEAAAARLAANVVDGMATLPWQSRSARRR